MCLIVLAYNWHPDYKLIVAANRDERYDRPTQAATFWEELPDVVAGKDLESGGSWLGITRAGAFSAVTNFRDPSLSKNNPPSRGGLVVDFLKNSSSPKKYLNEVAKRADRYLGFNLLVGTPDQLGYYSNQTNAINLLDSGIYGLSNHLLDTPWPKIQRAKNWLKNLIQEDKLSEEHLFELLADERQAPDEELPSTGIPIEIERKVSPIFINGEKYGTRSSTILLIGRDGHVTFTERQFASDTKEVDEENRYTFKIES